MACLENQPCAPDYTDPCSTSPITPAVPEVILLDSNNVIYHSLPGQPSGLSCLQLASGITLTQFMEAVDHYVCQNHGVTVNDLTAASCLSPGDATVPSILNRLILQSCQNTTQLQIGNLITLLTNSNAFLTELGNKLAIDNNFISKLLQNSSFLTQLATNDIFTTALANNNSFIDKFFNNTRAIYDLINNNPFLTQLADALTTNTTLKQKFCCTTTTSPCAGLVINGVTLTDCSCIPPTNLVISGPQNVVSGSSSTFAISYNGTPGAVAWTITGGTLVSHSAYGAVAKFTSNGTITATLTGCDGNPYTVVKTVTLQAVCVAVTGLTVSPVTLNETIVANQYKATVLTGSVLSYQWQITGGTITGSTTDSAVTVTWINATGILTVITTDCSGISQQTTFNYYLETISAPLLTCRVMGTCNDNSNCGVRYQVVYTGLQPIGTYTTALISPNYNQASLYISNFLVNGTSATADLNYTETNGFGTASATIVLYKNGQLVTTYLVSLGHSTPFSQLSVCNTQVAQQAPTTQGNQYTITFDPGTIAGPYTYSLNNNSGQSLATGNF